MEGVGHLRSAVLRLVDLGWLVYTTSTPNLMKMSFPPTTHFAENPCLSSFPTARWSG